MKLIILLLLSINLYSATITVAVSANVTYAIGQLKKEFNKIYPNISVKTTIASSGKLTALIENNAPYGIFLSADMSYPNRLYKSKKAITKPIVYAKGVLSYISSRDRDFTKGIDILRDDKVTKIAIANPKIAPYGKATIEALKNAKIYKEIKDKFVYGNSISQTLFYALNATDIGVVAKSSLYSPRLKGLKKGKNYANVNPKLYTPINQGVVLLEYAKGNPNYRLFYDFILSQKAKEVFKRYGYIVKWTSPL